MALFELRIELALAALAAVEEVLIANEELSLTLWEDKPSGRAWLVGYFDSREDADAAWRNIEPLFDHGWILLDPTVHELADKDWKESYKEHFKAWTFGRLHWVPVWERARFVPPAGDSVLWLDPGMAFGTGNHETTRLVVERLVSHAAAKGVNGRVIDAGCGSGILALSAAKLGYEEVAAFDNDPLAVEVSRENAFLNDLGWRVEFYVGDLVSGLAGVEAELVLANIQADVLIRYARQLLDAVGGGGRLVMSGILANELPQVRTAFCALAPSWGVDSRVMGEWSDFVLIRS